MVSVPTSSAWPLEQLIKSQRSQPALVERALQRLLADDDELLRTIVVGAYRDEGVSLARAASLLGLHPLELREDFIEKGIPLRLGPADLADARAEIEAIRAWKQRHDARWCQRW